MRFFRSLEREDKLFFLALLLCCVLSPALTLLIATFILFSDFIEDDRSISFQFRW